MKLRILVFLFLVPSIINIYSQQKDELKLDFNSRKQLYGYRNYKNKLAIKYSYTFAEPFKEDLAVVEGGLKFGYIDKSGEFAIGFKFDDAGSFSNGLAYFSLDLKKYGYINKNGKVVIEPKFNGAYDFKNGYAKVLKLNPDTSEYGDIRYIQGIIDKSGNLIGNQWFSFVFGTIDSISKVRIKEDIFNLNLLNGELQKPDLSDVETDKKDPIFDVMPEFPGGELGLRRYIAQYVRYPVSARNFGIQGKAYTRFAISKTGKVVEVEIARRVHPILDKESVRVIKTMPKWKAGMKNGKPVKVWYTVPINFQLN